jgi:recombination protein RecT
MSDQSQQQQHPVAILRDDIGRSSGEFAKLLPPSITPQAFGRIAITAIHQHSDPRMAQVVATAEGRRSILAAMMKAAEDRLLPDGREGALVVFNTKMKDQGGREAWVNVVQWLPMVEGVRKVLARAGIGLRTKAVYAGDEFKYEEGDKPGIVHRPRLDSKRSDDLIAVYAIAFRLADGVILDRDVMPRAMVEEIRQTYTKSGGGRGWSNPVSYPEMAIKTVVHHISKSLAEASDDLARVVGRDHFMYDMGGRQDAQQATVQPHPQALALPGPDSRPTPMEASQRTPETALAAVAGGEPQQAPQRRRRTKAEMEAARAAEEAQARQQQAAQQAQTAQQRQPDPAPAPAQETHWTDDSTEYDQTTGEVYEDGEAQEAASPQAGGAQDDDLAIPANLKRAADNTLPVQQAPAQEAAPDGNAVMVELKNIMDSAQPSNKGEYIGFVSYRWEYAKTAVQKEAVRKYWEYTGGLRRQIGVTAEDGKDLAAQMRRQQPA